jgi:pimeloyl-ACP methyl ester carboxylesterase
LLLHGISGHGYKTWGRLPEILFDDPSLCVDVGVFDYRSGLRILLGYRGGPVGWVDQVAEHLKDLAARYDHVVLVGHSQGGVVSERAVRARLSADMSSPDVVNSRPPKLSVVAGLILISAPRAGSSWISDIFARFVGSTRLLPVFNDASSETEQFFTDTIDRRNVAGGTGQRYIVPSYSCVAAGDRVVKKFSATHAIPGSQRKTLSTTHVRIAKVRDGNDEIVGWIRGVIGDILAVRRQAFREHKHTQRVASAKSGEPPTVITELLSDDAGFEFDEIYRQQCASINRSDVMIMDAQDAIGVRAGGVDVLMAAHNAERFTNQHPKAKTNFGITYRRLQEEPALTAHICAIGKDTKGASDVIDEWLSRENGFRSPYVELLPDANRFREHVARVLNAAVNRKLASLGSRILPAPADYRGLGGGDL